MEIIAIVVIVVVIIGWLAYEMIMAPLMPDDYGMTDEEIEYWNKRNNNKNLEE